MKKIILSLAVFTSVAALAGTKPADVNEKVLKAFKESFTKATNVVWQEYDNLFQANFTQDDIQVRAQYDQDGGLVKTIRYYGEKQLLPNILCKLKKKYGSKEIFGVTETTSTEEVSFVITIRDAKNYILVRSDAYGNLEQTDKFQRADL